MKTLRIGIIAGLVLTFACNKPKIEPLTFFEVQVQSEPVDLNSVKLKGQIIRQGDITEGLCGFIWSYDRTAVAAIQNGVNRIPMSFPPLQDNGNFMTIINNLERGKTVYARAFAQVRDPDAGERLVYSDEADIASFTVGEVVALTGAALIFNDSAVVFGQLRGVKGVVSGLVVSAHGHVVSETNPAPALGCSDCQAYNNGSSNDDNVFDSSFPGLKFNTTYHVRAYAIAGADTFYSQRVDTFRVMDGWERIGDFKYGYAEGAVATWNGRAYAGFGCKKSNGCMPADLVADFWTFDPAGPTGSGDWATATSISPFITNRYNAAAFALDNAFYAIFGEYYENNVSNPVRDFCKLDLQSNTWIADIPFDPAFTRRTGAVAFVLNGYAYVGLGRDKDFKELNDFWEYNPATTTWRKVASMPLRFSPLDNAQNLGRYEATVFTVDEYAYVGTGQWKTTALRDFWRFRAPAGTSSDMGEWTPVAFLPPEAVARYQAVAFSIGKKGYTGTGYNPTEGYLRDFWEYDPMMDKWAPRTPFPGLARTNAMGFALNGEGYVGTGQTKVPVNGGLSYTELSLPDFWRYIPATN